MDKVKNKVQTLVDAHEHVLYCGVTMSGKTTLARYHARILESAGYDLIVYDPVRTATKGGDWPEKAEIITTPEAFHKRINALDASEEHPVFIFVDEAADIFDHGEREAHWIPRKIRHEHGYLRMISQRPKMLHPNVRTQCAYAYILRLSSEDSRIICADFGHSADVAQIQLDKGDCLLLASGSRDIERFNVFDLVN
jgi:DNA helicase HerA-like ATPase